MTSVATNQIVDNHIGLSSEILFDLEERLAKPHFLGVPLGSTLSDNFAHLFKGNQDLGFRSVVRDIFLCLKYLFRSIPHSRIERDLPKKRIVVTWLGDRPSLREMVLPLVCALGSSRCLVIGAVPEMKNILPDETAFMTFDQAPAFDMRKWRKKIFPLSMIWIKTLLEARRKYHLSLRLIPSLLKTLLIQSQKVMAFHRLIDDIEPISVITEYDRHHNSSCLVLSSRARNITSISLQHGLINPPYGYTPILADHLLCWGEPQRQLLIKQGSSPMRVHVTGAMSIRGTTLASSEDVLYRLGLRSDSPVILLATSPINNADRKKLVETFCTENLPSEIQRVVRLHPSEQLKFYASEISKFKYVKFTQSDDFSLDEALAAANFVCCHDSTVGLQALIRRKPVLVLDVLKTPLSGGLEYVEAAGCPRITTVGEFVGVMKRALSQVSENEDLFQQQQRYVDENYAKLGEEAVSATSKMIDNIISKSRVD